MKALILLLLPLMASAQLSIQVGTQVGKPFSSSSYPYHDSFEERYSLPVGVTAALGYRLNKWASLKASYLYYGLYKEKMIEEPNGRWHSWSLEPELTFLNIEDSGILLKLGLPVAWIRETTEWNLLNPYQTTDVKGVSIASGRDQMTAFRFGMAPGILLPLGESNWSAELSLACYFEYLQSHERSIERNSSREDLSDYLVQTSKQPVEVRVGLSYSFSKPK